MTICVAYVHSDEVAYSWHASMLGALAYDIDHEQLISRSAWIATRYGTGGLPHARNKTVQTFLNERSDPWLLWVDTDMGFAPDAITTLAGIAHEEIMPVVGGLAFMSLNLTPDGMGGWQIQPRPTLFDWDAANDGFKIREDWARNQIVKVDATGSAFLLVHRSVFQQVQEQFGPSWYSPVSGRHGTFGEDLGFCLRVTRCGIPIHVATNVRTSHLKPMWLDENLHDRIESLT